MNSSDYENPNKLSRQDLIILKLSVIGCGLLLSVGLLVYATAWFQTISKASSDGTVNPGKVTKEQNTLTPSSEAPMIITKKPQQPITIEEGSQAWFCLKNNGGTGCLNRDRFAPNYKIIQPPKPQKNYDDYLVQYGIRPGVDCERYLNGKPNDI